MGLELAPPTFKFREPGHKSHPVLFVIQPRLRLLQASTWTNTSPSHSNGAISSFKPIKIQRPESGPPPSRHEQIYSIILELTFQCALWVPPIIHLSPLQKNAVLLSTLMRMRVEFENHRLLKTHRDDLARCTSIVVRILSAQ